MTYQVADSYTWKSLKQGIVILNLNDGSYFTLNETASHVWKKMLDGLTEIEIAKSLQQEFDCSADESVEDVGAYLEACVEEGIISIKADMGTTA